MPQGPRGRDHGCMNLITRAELREKLERHEDFKLVMTLSVHAYEEKRIPTSLHADSVEDALAAVQDLLAFAPHVEDRLSSADRKAVALLRASAGAEELRQALAECRAFASPGALLTRNVRWVLDRQSPLRIAAASAAQMARCEFGRRRQAQRRA